MSLIDLFLHTFFCIQFISPEPKPKLKVENHVLALQYFLKPAQVQQENQNPFHVYIFNTHANTL